MFVAGNVLSAVATILDYVLWLYMVVIIARALISWSPGSVESNRAISRSCDRTRLGADSSMGRVRMGMDLSPMIAILIIWFLREALVKSLKELAMTMN